MQEKIYHNPGIAKLKQIVLESAHNQARFVITRENRLIAGDAQYFTHHDMDIALDAPVTGYINLNAHEINGEWFNVFTFSAYKNHSCKWVDDDYVHPILERFKKYEIEKEPH
jgi:hypothetical protein